MKKTHFLELRKKTEQMEPVYILAVAFSLLSAISGILTAFFSPSTLYASLKLNLSVHLPWQFSLLLYVLPASCCLHPDVT